jgi:LMBR1 domain-containing protein 1
MVDAMLVFLTVVVILIFILVFIGNIYILAYFSHPEDNITNGIWYYRGLVIMALSFACYIIFTIPLDISSSPRSDSIGLSFPMDILWSVIDFVVCASVMFFLPLALVVYTNIETSIVSLDS